VRVFLNKLFMIGGRQSNTDSLKSTRNTEWLALINPDLPLIEAEKRRQVMRTVVCAPVGSTESFPVYLYLSD